MTESRAARDLHVSAFIFVLILCNVIVSENKVLTHPSSVDSITTSGGTEDHVSMGGFAARKAVTVIEHVEYGERQQLQLERNLQIKHTLGPSVILSFIERLSSL